ncbi:MerR family transcriptional regulator [Priestia endophytica]
MSSDTDASKVYSAKEVSVLLGIQNTTVRKYSQLLEKAGYHIHKNELGHRGFFDKDVIVLRKIIELTKRPDMSLENALICR